MNKKSTSFNLTAHGRQLLAEKSSELLLSQGKYLINLIVNGKEPNFDGMVLKTGPNGGAKSLFYGKNRGTTTATYLTPQARTLLDQRASKAKVSRGDYVEALLRKNA